MANSAYDLMVATHYLIGLEDFVLIRDGLVVEN